MNPEPSIDTSPEHGWWMDGMERVLHGPFMPDKHYCPAIHPDRGLPCDLKRGHWEMHTHHAESGDVIHWDLMVTATMTVYTWAAALWTAAQLGI